jgi:hypothetical protein
VQTNSPAHPGGRPRRIAVAAVQELYAQGRTDLEIGQALGVHRSSIWVIRRNLGLAVHKPEPKPKKEPVVVQARADRQRKASAVAGALSGFRAWLAGRSAGTPAAPVNTLRLAVPSFVRLAPGERWCRCGESIPAGATFCMRCGRRQHSVDPLQVLQPGEYAIAR